MSGTGSNLNLGTAVDTRPLEEGMARAKRAVQDFTNEAGKTAGGLNQASEAARNATTAFGSLNSSAGEVARSLLAAGTAGTTGAFPQIAGVSSTAASAISEMGAVAGRIPGILGLVGAAATAAAAGIANLTLRSLEYARAGRAAFAVAAMQGRNADFGQLQFQTAAAQIAKDARISVDEAMKIATAINSIPVSDATRDGLFRMGAAFHTAFSETTAGDAAKTAEEIKKIFSSTDALRSWLEANKAVIGTNLSDWNEALRDRAKMEAVALAGMERTYGRALQTRKDQDQAYTNWALAKINAVQKQPTGAGLPDTSRAAFEREMGMSPGVTTQLRPSTAPMSQELRDAIDLMGQYKSAADELMKLEAERATFEKALAASTDENNNRALENKLDQIRRQIDAVKALGDAGFEQNMRLALEQEKNLRLANVTDAKKLRGEELRVELEFWNTTARAAAKTGGEITAVETNVARIRNQLRAQELNEAAAAGRAGAAEAKRAEAERIAALVQGVRTTARVGQEEIATRRAQLQEEVNAGQITKAQMLADLVQYVSERRQLQSQQLDEVLAQIPQEAAAARQLADEKLLIEQRLNRELSQLRAQQAQEERERARQVAQQYIQAFSGVESSFKSSITGLLMGTSTWAKATQSVLQSVLGGFVDLGMKMVGNWVATQIAMTMTTQTQTAVQNAIYSGQSGFGALMQAMITGWTTKEAIQTGATAAGVATRTSIVVAGAAVEKTAEKSTAMTAIGGDAAAAAAGAYKALVGIPVVGPILAPLAAAAAFAAVMAFGNMMPSFDAGTMNVPQDMTARIHKGEMIVPAGVASAWRAGQAARGFDGGMMGGAAAINLSFSVQAIDTQSGLQFIDRHARAIARKVKRELSLNPSSRPRH